MAKPCRRAATRRGHRWAPMEAALPGLLVSGAGYASGLLTQDHALMVFCGMFFLNKLLGGAKNEDAEKLVGQKAPDVTFTTMDGATEQLSKYLDSGLPTVIDFYQSF